MKKFLLSVLAIGGFISLHAQGPWIEDSIIAGNAYKNRVFYSLQDGEQGSLEFNNRDLLVDPSSMSSIIRINAGFNAQLYRYTAGDTAAWASLDTAGLGAGTNFVRCYDDAFSYSFSAFENGATGHPNYGWGVYNDVTHIVTGNVVFVYKTVGTGTIASQVWKKVWVIKKQMGVFTLRIADLNGSNDQLITIDGTTGAGDNFVHYSFDANQTYNDEPNADTYDIIFTKYEGYLDNVQSASRYVISGVNNNYGVYASKARPFDVETAEFADFPIDDSSFATIGDSWKGLVMVPSPHYEAHDSTSYFVSDRNGNLWQLAFTNFYTGSGPNVAKYVFKKRILAYASIEETESVSAWTVFPNPAADVVSVVFNSSKADMAQFNVVDLNGRIVLTENMNVAIGVNQYTVDLGSKNLPAGIYVATLRAGNVIKTTKLIIQ